METYLLRRLAHTVAVLAAIATAAACSTAVQSSSDGPVAPGSVDGSTGIDSATDAAPDAAVATADASDRDAGDASDAADGAPTCAELARCAGDVGWSKDIWTYQGPNTCCTDTTSCLALCQQANPTPRSVSVAQTGEGSPTTLYCSCFAAPGDL